MEMDVQTIRIYFTNTNVVLTFEANVDLKMDKFVSE
jgi:hypothetical protein